METLEQPVSTEQTLDIDESRVSGSDPVQTKIDSSSEIIIGVERNVSRETVINELFETEIFVKDVDEKGIGDVSVVKISSSEGRIKMGRKSISRKDSENGETVSKKNGGSVESESTEKLGLSENEENEVDEDGEEGDVANEFSVGDFVWAKIRSYPWWPGQIFSPSDASATAGKHRRRNRLLVACFGDGTFAWCYPSQLKPFRENFDKLNQSSSKNFVVAVREAVNKLGKSLEFEMACSCWPVECKPAKSVVINAGIKEGVVVPNGGLGDLSISLFQPAEFLSHLKYIAEVVSVNSELELLDLKCRLSGFYRAKGYNQLMEYHVPMRIAISEDIGENELTGEDNAKDQIPNLNGSPVEADWLSPSADPGVGSTGITMSRRMSALSENILLNSKKQRNVSDLMLENLNAKDDAVNEPSFVEGTVSAKRGRPRKIREPIPSEVGSDAAEKLAVSQEMVSGESKENTISNGGHVNGISEELTTPAKARGRPKKIREPIPSTVENIAAAESDNSQAKVLWTSMETTDSKVNHANDVTGEVTESGKPRGRPKRKQNTDPEVGNDAVKESGVSGKQATPSSPTKKLKSSDVGDANGAIEEGSVSGKARGRLKKRKEGSNEDVTEENETKAFESGSGSVKESDVFGKKAKPTSTSKKLKSSSGGDANGAIEEGSVSVKARGRPKKRKEGSNEDVSEENKSKSSEVGNVEDVVKELPFPGKNLRRKKKTEDFEVQKEPDVAEELAGSRKRKEKTDSKLGTDSGIKEKTDSKLGTDSGIVEEGSTDGKQASTPKMPKETKPSEPSAAGASKDSDVENDDSGTKEGPKSSVSLRERKKSKYLSPPYTLLGQWQRDAASTSTDDSRKKSPRSPSSTLGSWPPVVKCIGVASESKPSKDSRLECDTLGGSTLPIESNATAHEILSDFRSAALDPLFLTEKQSDDTVKGFFTKFRSSSYQEGSDFTVYNNHLGGGGGRKRVSFDIKPGKDTNETGNPIFEDESEGTKRKKKNDEVLPSPKKRINSNGVVSGAALLLTFVPGASLPSKDEVITVFRPFGKINESETKVIEDSGCVQVVFTKKSDAEEAYTNTDKLSSFGSSVASYRLRYLSAKNAGALLGKVVNTASQSQPSIVPPPPLLSVRQNLENVTSALEKSWDKLSSELKTSFNAEIKSLLSKVTSTSMIDASSS